MSLFALIISGCQTLKKSAPGATEGVKKVQ